MFWLGMLCGAFLLGFIAAMWPMPPNRCHKCKNYLDPLYKTNHSICVHREVYWLCDECYIKWKSVERTTAQ